MKNTINLFLQNKNYKSLYLKNKSKLLKILNLISEEIKETNLVVSLSIVDSKKMKSINKENRNKDKTTDVLSFPMSTKGEGVYDLGDVFINFDMVKDDRHFIFLFVHSCLHLIGYTHDKTNDYKKMLKREQDIMSYII